MSPAIGWPLAYEWTAVSFLLAFSRFLHLSFLFGRASVGGAGGAGVEPPLRLALGLARPWGITVALLAAVLATLGLIPWWADLLRQGALVLYLRRSLSGPIEWAHELRSVGEGARLPTPLPTPCQPPANPVVPTPPPPSLTCSVKSFVGRVLTTVVLGALSAIACVQACVALTAKWYTCGAREAAVLRGAASRPAA